MLEDPCPGSCVPVTPRRVCVIFLVARLNRHRLSEVLTPWASLWAPRQTWRKFDAGSEHAITYFFDTAPRDERACSYNGSTIRWQDFGQRSRRRTEGVEHLVVFKVQQQQQGGKRRACYDKLLANILGWRFEDILLHGISDDCEHVKMTSFYSPNFKIDEIQSMMRETYTSTDSLDHYIGGADSEDASGRVLLLPTSYVDMLSKQIQQPYCKRRRRKNDYIYTAAAVG